MDITILNHCDLRGEIIYSFYPTFAGEMLSAFHEDRLCFAAFASQLGRDRVIIELQSRFPKAKLSHHACPQNNIIENPPSQILLVGTKFQTDIWQALLSIKYGHIATYSQVAQLSGHTQAIRATASAIGRNPICYTIPCHRIIPASGNAGNYHWGSEIKRILLSSEGISLP